MRGEREGARQPGNKPALILILSGATEREGQVMPSYLFNILLFYSSSSQKI